MALLSLPGEGIAIAIINALVENRRTMSQENRDRLDARLIKSLEDGDRFWALLLKPLMKALEKED